MQPIFVYHSPLNTFPDTPDEQVFDRLIRNVSAAEKAGFALATVMDHVEQISGIGPRNWHIFEAYTALAALAARTERIRLGAMVTGVTYRFLALLAKEVTTLDVISHGRAVLGLGAAWNEQEHHAYGYDFPPVGERLSRLEEALEICRLMFTQETSTFEGRFYRIDGAVNVPRPVQPGGPPILVGGSGEKRTLRILARYGTLGNWSGSLEEVTRLKGIFDEHCRAVDRDPAEVRITVMSPVLLGRDDADARRILEALTPERRVGVAVLPPEQAAEALRPFMDAGIGGFVLRNTSLHDDDHFELAAELMRLMGAGGPETVGRSA